MTRRANGDFSTFYVKDDVFATAAAITTIPEMVETLRARRSGDTYACFALVNAKDCIDDHVFPPSNHIQRRTRAALAKVYGDPAPAFRVGNDGCCSPHRQMHFEPSFIEFK